MNETALTKESRELLKKLYKAYKQNRKEGQSVELSRYFAGISDIQRYVPKWTAEDIESACGELWQADYLWCQPGDDTLVWVELKPEAIAYMQNGFLRAIAGIVDAISWVKNISPL